MVDLLVINASRSTRLIECLVKNLGDSSVRTGDLLTAGGSTTLEVLEIALYEGVMVDELEPNFGGRLLVAADGAGCPRPDDHLRLASA